jgi:hypothetical protein
MPLVFPPLPRLDELIEVDLLELSARLFVPPASVNVGDFPSFHQTSQRADRDPQHLGGLTQGVQTPVLHSLLQIMLGPIVLGVNWPYLFCKLNELRS